MDNVIPMFDAQGRAQTKRRLAKAALTAEGSPLAEFVAECNASADYWFREAEKTRARVAEWSGRHAEIVPSTRYPGQS
jgi:hypothetical protein